MISWPWEQITRILAMHSGQRAAQAIGLKSSLSTSRIGIFFAFSSLLQTLLGAFRLRVAPNYHLEPSDAASGFLDGKNRHSSGSFGPVFGYNTSSRSNPVVAATQNG